MIVKKELTGSQKQDLAKTTTDDEEKRYRMIKKLTSNNPQSFRDININEFDFNITQHFQQLQHYDDAVTPLIYCAHYGLKEILKHILKHTNIDVDQQTKNNRQTPLTVACMCGNYEIMRLLILAEAQINKPNIFNHSPLTLTLFRLMEEPNSFQNRKISFKMAQFLIQRGADVNWIIDKKKGYSLMHYFCSIKMKMNKTQKQLNYEIIKFLLKKGVNINQLTLKDKTVFDLLQTHCNKEEVTILIKQQAQKSQKVMMNKIPKHDVKKLGTHYFQNKRQQ